MKGDIIPCIIVPCFNTWYKSNTKLPSAPRLPREPLLKKLPIVMGDQWLGHTALNCPKNIVFH